MDTDKPDSQPPSPYVDAAVFCLTVAACWLLLSAACIFGKPVATTAHPLPELALPQAPGPLELVPGPAPEPWRAGAVPIEPVIDLCWEIPAVDASIEATDTMDAVSMAPEEAPLESRIPFHGIIIQAADRYEVDPHLIRAIILAESGYNPRAKSKKGARGLMQLMPSTAKALGVQDIYDPEENIDGGVRYFRSLLDRFDGDVQLALAAYNAGSRHVRRYEGVPPFKATRHYIKKVLKFHEKFKMEKGQRLRRLA